MSDPTLGQITIGRSPALPDIDVMWVRQNAQKWRVFHEQYVICSCWVAAAGWRYRGRDYIVSNMSHMLIEPGETHVNTKVLKPGDFVVLWIPPAVLENISRELGRKEVPRFLQPQVTDMALFAELTRLYNSMNDKASALEMQSHFMNSMRILLENHAESAPKALSVRGERRTIERAKQYLRDRVRENISLTDVAKFVGLSRFHLLRSFAQHVGVAPHGYQVRCRVEMARVMLQKGAAPAEAALYVGFADQSHMTRHFRKILGVTPGKFAALQSRYRRISYAP